MQNKHRKKFHFKVDQLPGRGSAGWSKRPTFPFFFLKAPLKLNSISSPIFTRGFREKLNFEDLPSLPAILKVHSLAETFRWRFFNHVCNLVSFPQTTFRRYQCSSTKSGLTRLLLACFGSRLLQGLLLRLVGDKLASRINLLFQITQRHLALYKSSDTQANCPGDDGKRCR